MRQVAFDPAAELEAAEAVIWYDARNRWAAQQFEIELSATVSRLPDTPLHFPIATLRVRHMGGDTLREARLRRFPYSVIFSVKEHSINVVAIAHDKRRPNYWTSRIT